MRIGPLTAALLVLIVPAAHATSNELTLSGPATLTINGETVTPLRVTLTLDKVICQSDAEIPVVLSIARAEGARASLASERIMFRLAAHGAAARAWSSDAEARLTVEPIAESGVVEVIARYELPAQCTAIGGVRAGEARRVIGIGSAAADAPPALPIPTLRASTAEHAERAEVPWGLQLAIAGSFVGGIAVVVKRLRWKPS